MICGADEAGRGPVLGPLVVAAVSVNDDSELRRIGVKDSKRLSPLKREELYPLIMEMCDVEVLQITAERIDEARREMSLNRMEAEAFAYVLYPFRGQEIFLDCVDPNETSFARLIDSLLGGHSKIVCEHRADNTYPVVAAASIVAKVVRDRAMVKLEKEWGESLGSGYPSDQKTISFLERWIKDKGNPPPFARCSWETTRRLMGLAMNSRITEW